jgi:hypothetical protein
MGYLYRHIRLDNNETFYIGIGGFCKREKEGTYKRAFAINKRNNIWKSIVNKTEYIVEIVLCNLSFEEAIINEIEYIKLFGRKDNNTGTLANMTDGGEGSLGVIKSEETLIKIINSLKGRIVSEETREKIRIANTGKKHTQETKDKLSIASKGNKNNIGKKHSEETKQKISNSKKGNISWNKGLKNCYSEEAKLKMGLGRKGKESTFKGKKHTEESNRKNSEAHYGKIPRSGFVNSPETRNKISETLMNGKKVEIDGIIYDSYHDAERKLGIKRTTIRYRIYSNSENYKNYKLVDVE